jgi:hypothetical protein
MPLIQLKQVFTEGKVNILPRETRQTIWIRRSVIALSLILGVYSSWQLTIELLRPRVPYFLVEPAHTNAGDVRAAAVAARIGLIRGDLWLDEALLASETSEPTGPGARSLPVLNEAREAATRSVQWAPQDARGWLLLSWLSAQLGLGSHQVIEALKMSYYTGPNDSALIPLRMDLAVRSTAIADPDFQSLVAGELRSAMRELRLQQAILSSYRRASPEGKHFLEVSVGALDAAMVAKMRAGAQ